MKISDWIEWGRNMHVQFVKRVLSHRSRGLGSETQGFHIEKKKDLARNVEGWGSCRGHVCKGLLAGRGIGFCGLGVNW